MEEREDDVEAAELGRLYEEAWARYGVTCLWSLRRIDVPGRADVEAVARGLRANGGLETYRLADRLTSMVRG